MINNENKNNDDGDLTSKDSDINIEDWFNLPSANAAKRLMTSEQDHPQKLDTATERPSTKTKRERTIGTAVVISLGVGAAIGLPIMNHQQGGSDSPYGDITPDLKSISLAEGANIRTDATVDSDGFGSNRILQLDAPVKIDAAGDFRKLGDTNNGTWIGIPIDEAAKAIPDLEGAKDNDGIVWVNQQGIESSDSSK